VTDVRPSRTWLGKPALLTAGIWAAIAANWAVTYILPRISDPGAIGYEGDWDFQLLMFAIFRLPWALLALVVVETVVLTQSRARP
jgi:hypothetical protein